MSATTRVLVLGASGMLGHVTLRFFAQSFGFEAWGTVRSPASRDLLPEALHPRLTAHVDVSDLESVKRAIDEVKPSVVINCVGIVKQLASADDPLEAIPINSLLPHQLALICGGVDARLVHVSTDCVFSGSKGMYVESDFPDAYDLYGRTKLLGEVEHQPHAITLRTSIIGPELSGAHGLVGWFLSQDGPVRGFTRAVFSGLPTVELARVIRDHVVPHRDLHGVYHVSSEPINKYDLLQLVANAYDRTNEISRDDRLVIDRSLDSTRFRDATGYKPAPWPELVRLMRDFS